MPYLPSTTNIIMHRLFTIHDMLPDRKGLPGLAVSEVHERLAGKGIHVDIKTVERDLKLIVKLFFVNVEVAGGQTHRYKRENRACLLGKMRNFAEGRLRPQGARTEGPDLNKAVHQLWKSNPAPSRAEVVAEEVDQATEMKVPNFPSDIDVTGRDPDRLTRDDEQLTPLND